MTAQAAYRGVAASKLRAPFGAWSLRLTAAIYLTTLIMVPVLVICVEGLRGGADAFWHAISRPQAVSAIWLSVWTAVVMAVINMGMGTLTAYVLIGYRFPGKRLLNAVIDLPFAIPTLVTGVMLVLLYGPQTAIGGLFENSFGTRLIYAPPGIILALLFLGYPFVTGRCSRCWSGWKRSSRKRRIRWARPAGPLSGGLSCPRFCPP